MSCAQFRLRCMELLEALREHKRGTTPRDASAR
jgi:hypothetical protein